MICPYCKEEIKDGAKKCRFCWEFLNNINEIEIDVNKENDINSKEEEKITTSLRTFLHTIVFIWWTLIFFFIARHHTLFLIPWLFLCVWYSFCSWNDEKHFFDFKSTFSKERIKNKTRYITAIILCGIFLLTLMGIKIKDFHNQKVKEKEIAHQNEIIAHENYLRESAPEIVITINSSTWHITSWISYLLDVTIAWADTATINWEEFENTNTKTQNIPNIQSWLFFSNINNKNIEKIIDIKKEFELTSTSTTINISWKNKYKSGQQTLIITRDKTPEEIEAERLEEQRKEEERVNSILSDIDNYIKQLNDINKEEIYYTTEWSYNVTNVDDIIDDYKRIAKFIKEYQDDSNANIVKKIKNLKTQLITSQKKVYPKMRSAYCKNADKILREYDVDVTCNWTTITFVWYHFSLNSNIKDAHQAQSSRLRQLRFKRANYKRSNYGEYSYYNIDSLNDWDIE